jgi:hypothetical protein
MSEKKQARSPAPKHIVRTPLGPLPESFFRDAHACDGRDRRPDQSSHKARLLEQLAEAHETWCYTKSDEGSRERTKADQEGIRQRRYATQLVIGAFLEWAYAEGDIPNDHLLPLVTLAGVLSDLNSGRQPELVRPSPRPRRGNPQLTVDRKFMLVTACAAVDVLSGGKRGEVAEAERRVARALGMEVGALRSWRKAFMAGTRGRKARKVYDEMKRMFDEHGGQLTLLEKMRRKRLKIVRRGALGEPHLLASSRH